MMNSERFAVHVGLPKCASTFLQKRFFPTHPAISYLGPLGGCRQIDELWEHLVGANGREWNRERASALLSSAMKTVPNAGKIAAISRENIGINATVSYREKAERLCQIMPTAKIVIVVREPVSLIESIYLQHAKGFGVKRPFVPFGDWWEAQLQLAETSHVLSRLEFSGLADCYARLFGRDRVRVLRFETFVHNQRAFFDCLCDFLAIEPWNLSAYSDIDIIANPRQSQSDLLLARLPVGKLRSTVSAVGRLLPRGIKAYLKRPAHTLMTPEIRNDILRLYTERNVSLASRWNVDYHEA